MKVWLFIGITIAMLIAVSYVTAQQVEQIPMQQALDRFMLCQVQNVNHNNRDLYVYVGYYGVKMDSRLDLDLSGFRFKKDVTVQDKDDTVNLLQELHNFDDNESKHMLADEVIIAFLVCQGFDEVAAAYSKLSEKFWYA